MGRNVKNFDLFSDFRAPTKFKKSIVHRPFYLADLPISQSFSTWSFQNNCKNRQFQKKYKQLFCLKYKNIYSNKSTSDQGMPLFILPFNM